MPIKFTEEHIAIVDDELTKVPDEVFKSASEWFYYLKIKPDVLKTAIKNDIVNKEGKFFKRLQKYLTLLFKERKAKGLMGYHDLHHVKNHLESFRTSIIDKEIINYSGYTFTFSDEFNWEQGDYGDPDSCFFDDGEPKDYIKEKLENNGFKAFKLSKGKEGIGRGLLLPDSLCSRANGRPIKGWLLMNCYGITLSRAAAILKAYWRVPATEIQLHDSSLCGEDMFINNGTAIYLGPKVIRKRKTLYMRGSRTLVSC